MELQILLFLLSQHWDCRHVPLCLAFMWVLGIGLRSLGLPRNDWAWAFKSWAVCWTHTAMTVMLPGGEHLRFVSDVCHHVCSLLLTCDVPLCSMWPLFQRSRYRKLASVTGPKKLGMRVWQMSIWQWLKSRCSTQASRKWFPPFWM